MKHATYAEEYRTPVVKTAGARGAQDHRTPPELIEALVERFGRLVFDLAADAPNVCPEYFDEEVDSLSMDWHATFALHTKDAPGWFWLNPPFSGGIDPTTNKHRTLWHWMKKCWEESRRGCRILALVPYSADAVWWCDWVLGKARTEGLAPRVQFVGSDAGYPKPLALLVYEPGVLGAQGGHWYWKAQHSDKQSGPRGPSTSGSEATRPATPDARP